MQHSRSPLRFFILSWILLLASTEVYAQQTELADINRRRLNTNQTFMWVLGGWAAANILSGAVLRGQTEGSTRYFHEMNLIWNTVNLGIAGFGLWSAYTTDPATFNLWETYQEQQKLEKILWFNEALNVSYILGGVYLMERAKNASNNPDRLKGYGQSLILQGTFLLLFDATQLIVHHTSATPQLRQLLSHVSFNGQALTLTFAF